MVLLGMGVVEGPFKTGDNGAAKWSIFVVPSDITPQLYTVSTGTLSGPHCMVRVPNTLKPMRKKTKIILR